MAVRNLIDPYVDGPFPFHESNRVGWHVVALGRCIATADSKPEANGAVTAFKQALLPRFTRAEAVARVHAAYPHLNCDASPLREAFDALAAAGMFSDVRL